MIHIAKRYPERVAINWGDPETKLLDQKDKPTIMYVRGKLGDWKLTDRGLNVLGDRVSTLRRHLKGREIGQTSQRIPNKVFEKKRE